MSMAFCTHALLFALVLQFFFSFFALLFFDLFCCLWQLLFSLSPFSTYTLPKKVYSKNNERNEKQFLKLHRHFRQNRSVNEENVRSS